MISVVGLVAGAVASYSIAANATHIDDPFELDGNLVDAGTAGLVPIDWESVFNANTTAKTGLPAGFVGTGFDADYVLPDDSGYATGTKDTLGIDGWQCKKPNNLGGKFDLLNAYGVAYRGTDGHLRLYFASEIASPNGSRNAGFWFLQDEGVGCASTGPNLDFSGEHTDGDIFVVSAFTDGGNTANVSVYEWVGDDATGYLDETPLGSGGECDGTLEQNACAIVNDSSVTPPWTSPSSSGTGLKANQFFEGAVDLTALLLETAGTTATPCFASFVANSRSSHEPGSTLHDFAAGSMPTCGSLDVYKFIDVDGDGVRDTGSDLEAGTHVADWPFTVRGPHSATASNADVAASPLVCSGVTSSTAGKLSCSISGSLLNLAPGFYTVTESIPTAKSNHYKTAPAPDPAPAPVLSKRIEVMVAGGTIRFGNACMGTMQFDVTGAPRTGTIKAWYVLNGTETEITLSEAAGTPTAATTATFTATTGALFKHTDSITWGYVFNGTKNTASKTVSFATMSYPACAKSDTTGFAFGTINGDKFEDIDADGVWDTTPPEAGLDGFIFELVNSSSTVVQTVLSGSNGRFTFNNVVPGSYTVREVEYADGTRVVGSSTVRSPQYWAITTSKTRTLTVGIGGAVTLGTGSALEFGNTPLSKVQVIFTPYTTHTEATTSNVSCGSPTTSGSSSSVAGPTSAGVVTRTVDNIRGATTMTCTVTITHKNH